MTFEESQKKELAENMIIDNEGNIRPRAKNIDDLLKAVSSGVQLLNERFDQVYSDEQIKNIIDNLISSAADNYVRMRISSLMGDVREQLVKEIKDKLYSPNVIKSIIEELIREEEDY